MCNHSNRFSFILPNQNSLRQLLRYNAYKSPAKNCSSIDSSLGLGSSTSRVIGDTFFSLCLSEVKSSKKRGASAKKHAGSDEEDEVDEEQSEDETDSEGENMVEKEQRSSEEGTN